MRDNVPLLKQVTTNKKGLYAAMLGGGLFIVLAFSLLFFHNPLTKEGVILQQIRSGFLKNSLVIHLLHSYHSLRKLPDIIFAPFQLVSSKLPTYTLYITLANMQTLNSYLPQDNPVNGYLHNENRVFVSAEFIAGDYKEKVQVKYRGTNANHWNSFQKSWRIKFPSKHLFNGMSSIDLIIPYDRGYFVDALDFYRARKLGLTALDMSFVRMNINGMDMGVYSEIERYNNEWLSKRAAPDTLVTYNSNDSVNQSGTDVKTSSIPVDSRNAGNNGKYYFSQNTGSKSDADAVKAFYQVLENADDKTFKRLAPIMIDLPKLYAFSVVSILSGSRHYDGSFGNVYLIFNPEKGQFEIAPWDLAVEPIDSASGNSGDNRIELTDRVFSIPEFRDERNKLLKSYIENPSNLSDDMKFFDGLYANTKYDFFTDNAKLYNNIQFLSQVRLFRQTFVDNFSAAKAILDYGNEYYKDDFPAAAKREPLALKGAFSRLLEAGYSIDEFIAANPSFVKRDVSTVALPEGAYYFDQDIIVPVGLKLVIDPGAMLYLGTKTSLISYSPVIARGNVQMPIRILRAGGKAWGTFGVVNTESNKSIIDHVEFDGGSGAAINGIVFTGMAAFHNADVDISFSTFQNSSEAGVGGDDGLNIKYGKALITNSLFRHTFSDGIDTDAANKVTTIRDNAFYDIGYDKAAGGDAMDISWSDILIENNTVHGCTDKGVSVGEGSRPLVENNHIDGCNIGVAVKDRSVAVISNNNFTNTKIGVSAYRKKPEFLLGGTARVSANTFKNVGKEYERDAFSSIYLAEQQKYLP